MEGGLEEWEVAHQKALLFKNLYMNNMFIFDFCINDGIEFLHQESLITMFYQLGLCTMYLAK